MRSFVSLLLYVRDGGPELAFPAEANVTGDRRGCLLTDRRSRPDALTYISPADLAWRRAIAGRGRIHPLPSDMCTRRPFLIHPRARELPDKRYLPEKLLPETLRRV